MMCVTMSTTPIRLAAGSRRRPPGAAADADAARASLLPRRTGRRHRSSTTRSRLQVALTAADDDGNLVFSPASIAIGLSMTSAGAAGQRWRSSRRCSAWAIRRSRGDGGTDRDTDWYRRRIARPRQLLVDPGRLRHRRAVRDDVTDVYAAPPRQVDSRATRPPPPARSTSGSARRPTRRSPSCSPQTM